MLPLKRIICCTDFSDPSYKAVESAQELAMFFKAKLYVVHVVSPVPVAAPADAFAHGQVAEAFNVEGYRKQLEEIALMQLEQVRAEHAAGVTDVQNVVLHGKAAHRLLGLVEEVDADLLVISTHGRTGVRRAVFGSVAEQVVRRAQCPVLTVHVPEKGH